MNWIDINERKPEIGQECLVYFSDEERGHDTDLITYDPEYLSITYWMPLPDPPRKVRWMPKVGESFYYIGRDGIPIEITSHVDDFMVLHYRAFAGLYRTYEEADQMAAKIRKFVADEIGEVE